jgi:hypothetical protein
VRSPGVLGSFQNGGQRVERTRVDPTPARPHEIGELRIHEERCGAGASGLREAARDEGCEIAGPRKLDGSDPRYP